MPCAGLLSQLPMVRRIESRKTTTPQISIKIQLDGDMKDIFNQAHSAKPCIPLAFNYASTSTAFDNDARSIRLPVRHQES
jgi:hypothetical protein